MTRGHMYIHLCPMAKASMTQVESRCTASLSQHMIDCKLCVWRRYHLQTISLSITLSQQSALKLWQQALLTSYQCSRDHSSRWQGPVLLAMMKYAQQSTGCSASELEQLNRLRRTLDTNGWDAWTCSQCSSAEGASPCSSLLAWSKKILAASSGWSAAY